MDGKCTEGEKRAGWTGGSSRLQEEKEMGKNYTTLRNISQNVKGQRHIAGSGKIGPPPPLVSLTCWEFFDKLSGF